MAFCCERLTNIAPASPPLPKSPALLSSNAGLGRCARTLRIALYAFVSVPSNVPLVNLERCRGQGIGPRRPFGPGSVCCPEKHSGSHRGRLSVCGRGSFQPRDPELESRVLQH